MRRLTKKTSLNNLDGGKLYKVNADYSKCEDLDDRKFVSSKVISKIIDKCGRLEDVMECFGIETVEELEGMLYERKGIIASLMVSYAEEKYERKEN